MDSEKRFWAAVGVTIAVVGLYGAVVLGIAPKPEPDLAETLKALVTLAVGYWIGSSSGSAAKDKPLEEIGVSVASAQIIPVKGRTIAKPPRPTR